MKNKEKYSCILFIYAIMTGHKNFIPATEIIAKHTEKWMTINTFSNKNNDQKREKCLKLYI